MPSTLHGSSLLLVFASPFIVGEAVPSFHLGTSFTHTFKRFSDFDGLQCAELCLLTRYLTDGDLFHLHFEAWDWGPSVHVGPQSPTAICNQAP